jgi:hypothetical protein
VDNPKALSVHTYALFNENLTSSKPVDSDAARMQPKLGGDAVDPAKPLSHAS